MDTRTFLGHLCVPLLQGETLEIRTFHRGGPRDGKPGPRLFHAHPAELAAHAAALRPGIDAYYTLNPRRDEDGTKAGVTRVRFLHLDLDFKLFDGGEEDARAAIDAFLLRPTWIVRTGGGFQCLWELVEALAADAPTVALAEGIMKELYRVFADADAVQDISRIFRLPGTRNHKYPERPLVTVERHDPQSRYTLDDFLAIVPPPVETPRQSRPPLHFDDPSAELLRDMLRHVNPQPGYRDWVRVLAAIHSAFPGPEGEAIAEEWSPGDERNPVAEKFRSFGQYKGLRGPASIGTIVYLAKQGGWQPPAPTWRPPAPPQRPPVAESGGASDAPPQVPGAAPDVAGLVAELAALRLEVADLRQRCDQEHAARLKVERLNRALVNFDRARGIKTQKPTVKAALFVYNSKVSRGEADGEGWVPTSRAEIAEVGAVSLDAAGDQLDAITSWGVGFEKKVIKEEYVEVDARGQAVVQSRPRILLRVDGETVDKLEELCGFVAPSKPGKSSWGGKRDACASCGSTNTHRETRVVCDECGHVSKPLATAPAFDPATEHGPDEPDPQAPSVPPTPVVVPPRATYPPGEVSYAEEEETEDEADTYDPFFCNWRGCDARVKMGQIYCDHHQGKPHVPPPPRVPLIVGVPVASGATATMPVAPPPAPPGASPAPPQRRSWCLNYRGAGKGCQHRVGGRGDAYCAGCVAEGYVNGPPERGDDHAGGL